MPPSDHHPFDWDPTDPEIQADQRAAYDRMRDRCPVARGADGGWTAFRHDDVRRIITDHDTFSNVVSAHPAVPNGMDPPEHTIWRRFIEPCFSAERVAAFEPACRRIAARLARSAREQGDVELMSLVGLPFAAEVQCAYLGWPETLAATLVDWTERNHEATRKGDRADVSHIAAEFGRIVDGLLETRRAAPAGTFTDLTQALLGEVVDGRPAGPEALTSILRNWTMGEVGTIAASVGIIAHFLAHSPGIQHEVRLDRRLVPEAIDEILRMHGPLVSNRRTVTRAVEVGERQLERGDRVTVNWIAANRDPEVFPEPDEFRLDRHTPDSLLYGDGIHVCPGAGLARLELRVMVEALLDETHSIASHTARPAVLARPPAGGFSAVPLRLS